MSFCRPVTSRADLQQICQSEAKYERSPGFRNFRYQAIEPRSSLVAQVGVNHTTLTAEQREAFMNDADDLAREYEQNVLVHMRTRNEFFFPSNFSPKQQAIGQRHVLFRDYSPHEYAVKLRENLNMKGSLQKFKHWMAEYLTHAYIFDSVAQSDRAHQVFVSGRPVCSYHFYEDLLARNKKLFASPEQFLFECVAVQFYMLNKYEQWPVSLVQWYRDKVSRYFEQRMALAISDMEERVALDTHLLKRYNPARIGGSTTGPSLHNFIIVYHLGTVNIDGPFAPIPCLDQNHEQWIKNICNFSDEVHQHAFNCL